MRTKDLENLGFDRNFIRQCIDKGIITPERVFSWNIIYADYAPQEYTQKDVELLWYTNLCRKMGFSYENIKTLINGGEVNLRQSLNYFIDKYTKEIEELKALIKFMKFVKCIGFIPSAPQKVLDVKGFSEFLETFTEDLNKENNMQLLSKVVEDVLNIEDMETVDEITVEKISQEAKMLLPTLSEDDGKCLAIEFEKISQNLELKPNHSIIQDSIAQICLIYTTALDMSTWDFVTNYIEVMSYDSDYVLIIKKAFGDEFVSFLQDALVQYLIMKEPDKIKQLMLNK